MTRMEENRMKARNMYYGWMMFVAFLGGMWLMSAIMANHHATTTTPSTNLQPTKIYLGSETSTSDALLDISPSLISGTGTTDSGGLSKGMARAQLIARMARKGNNAVQSKDCVSVDRLTNLTRSRRDPSSYVTEPLDALMRQQKKVVDAYVASDAFKERISAMGAMQRRGILINSGGRLYLTNLVVLLKVLRQELNCTLPVEVVWHSPNEMDPATLAALKEDFAPLTGFDVSAMPYPQHHRRVSSLQKYEGKVLALLFSSFQEVLMLDSDAMPLRDPTYIFDDPQYVQSGNLFWPDAWRNWVRPQLYVTVGLDAVQAKDILEEGKGFSHRDTESGQLVVNRVQHADVLEYMYWINSFSDSVYKQVWGDKDTLPLAFAVAGKAHMYSQVSVPPGGFFRWAEKVLRVKATNEVRDGYQMMGFIQFDRYGRPFTIHRTLNKWEYPDGHNYQISIFTPPMPYWWLHYYLAQDCIGPTIGIKWQYNAPPEAFTMYHINPHPQRLQGAGRGRQKIGLEPDQCPKAQFHEMWSLKEIGFPMDDLEELKAVCSVEALMLGAERHGDLCEETYLKYPQAKNLRGDYLEGPEAPGGGNSAPLPALGYSELLPLRAVQYSYKAYQWFLDNVKRYPTIAN